MATRRRKVMLIVSLILTVALLASGAWWFAWGRFEAKWERVQVGMTKEEVEGRLGEAESKGWSSEGFEVWTYRRAWHVEISVSRRFPWLQFERLPEFEVWFGHDWRVMKKEVWSGVWVSVG